MSPIFYSKQTTTIYGEYATEKNMEPYLKEGILSNAYYDHLIEQNAPGAQEIKPSVHQKSPSRSDSPYTADLPNQMSYLRPYKTLN